jgi:hypothetical protein
MPETGPLIPNYGNTNARLVSDRTAPWEWESFQRFAVPTEIPPARASAVAAEAD